MNLHPTHRIRKQLGQGMTEYIIIVALIAVSAIAVYAFFGQTVRHQTAGLANELAGRSATANITSARTSAQSATTEGTTNKNLGTYTNQTVNAGGN